jgi:hypothetical protein
MVELPMDGGGILLVQKVEADSGGGLGLASSDERLMKVGETIKSAPEKVMPGLKSAASRLEELSPNDMGVEFGPTLSAEGGAFIAKAGGEAPFTVTLNWSSGKDD